ncbi:MAG: antibiotic biosynthesis monooxygenase, partial [Deltaproteobacteria bacterium]|nr:antibiotic biosynthesis monooxygenase [Deltaproteobacteria bacterium]
MIAVIFEVHINEGKQEEYLQTAAELREHLAQV